MKNYFTFFICIFIFSCTNTRLVKDVKQFMNQRITLSSDLNTIWKSKDTILAGFTEVPININY